MDPLFEQLKRRNQGNKEALIRAMEIIRGMADPDSINKDKSDTESFFSSDIDQLEQQLGQQGIYSQAVSLKGKWWLHCADTMIGFMADSDAVVVLKPHEGGYAFTDPDTGKHYRLSYFRTKASKRISPIAYRFVEPLPARPLTWSDIFTYAFKYISRFELTACFLACVAVVLLTMLTPYVTKILFNEVIPYGDSSQILPMAGILLGASVSLVLTIMTRSLLSVRIKDRLEIVLQSALMQRAINLPIAFTKQYSPGDISERVLCLSDFSARMTGEIVSNLVNAVFSVALLWQFFVYGGQLFWVGLLGLVILIGSNLLALHYFNKQFGAVVKHNPKFLGFTYSVYSGIQKIKTNGAEINAFCKWTELMEKQDLYKIFPGSRKLMYSADSVEFVKSIPIVLIFVGAWNVGIGLSDYIAFLSAFSLAVAAINPIRESLRVLGSSLPRVRLADPILKASPEFEPGRLIVTDVSGSVDIEGLRFRYDEHSPYLMDGLSLTINPGEYVALVGPSGCGKSTLLRLLLGFETPEMGSIYFDQYNINEINKSSLRRNCVSTCQQDGKLVKGSIMDNIRLTSPFATEEEVWEAARIAALDEDIRKMPQGMDTQITEDGRGVSGGQQQRILIARSVIGKPRILLLDEATSALDNISQKIVTDNLQKMGCTRITIAHRISTIMHCDRIIVIDNGKVVQQGKYEELINQPGLFAEICKRQVA